MAKRAFGIDIDFGLHEAQNIVIQNLAIQPAGKKGQIIFNTATNMWEGFNGTSWGSLGGGSYTLPVATDSVLGGIKVPSTSDIAINATGEIDLSSVAKSKYENLIETITINGSTATITGKNADLGNFAPTVAGKIDPMYLPLEYIRDTHIVATKSALPTPPTTDQETDFFIVMDENTTYYWSGTDWTATARPVEYASQSEAETGTVTNKAMSPATTKAAIEKATEDVARVAKFVFGDGTATSFNVAHNLNNEEPTYIVYISGVQTEVSYTPTDANNGVLSMNSAPAAGTLKATFVG